MAGTPINWVLSRDTNSVAPNYSQLGPNHGIVLNAGDANLDAQVAAAKAAGVPFSIWVPASSDPEEPHAYAQHLAALNNKYHPTLLVPDLEFGQKGGPGTPQWQWNNDMMAEAKRLGISPQQLAITVMPNQNGGVFNYAAYQGAQIWPQAYGAKMTDQFSPDQVVNTVTGSGVDPSLVHPMLAPGQNYAGGSSETFTWDDMSPAQQQAFAQSNPQAAAAAQASPTTPVNVNGRPNHIPDSQNPAAIAYSKQKLKQLAQEGYTPEMYGLQGLDVTAQYRAMSAILGAQQAIKGGHAADYQIRPSTPDNVAQTIQQLLQMAQTPQNGPDNGALTPQQAASNQVPPPTSPSMPAPSAPTSPVHPVGVGAVSAPVNHGIPLLAPHTGDFYPIGTHHPSHSSPVPAADLQGPHFPGIRQSSSTHPIGVAHSDAVNAMIGAAKNLGPMQAAIHIAAALKMLRQMPAPTFHGGPQ